MPSTSDLIFVAKHFTVFTDYKNYKNYLKPANIEKSKITNDGLYCGNLTHSQVFTRKDNYIVDFLSRDIETDEEEEKESSPRPQYPERNWLDDNYYQEPKPIR